jgi:hypothetical protein
MGIREEDLHFPTLQMMGKRKRSTAATEFARRVNRGQQREMVQEFFSFHLPNPVSNLGKTQTFMMYPNAQFVVKQSAG